MAPVETTTTIQIDRPAPPAIVAELAPVVAEARLFQIENIESHAIALQRAKALRAGEKKIEEAFEPSRKAADTAKKEILTLRDSLIGPIAAARQIYDRNASIYEAQERQKAADEQRRLQEKARKEEEERQLAAAQEAQDRGDKDEAEAIVSEPVSAPVIHVAPAVAEVEGVSGRKSWAPEVYDVVECLLFMTRRQEWRAALERLKPELETILRPMATAQRQNLSIPGVRAVEKSVRSYR